MAKFSEEYTLSELEREGILKAAEAFSPEESPEATASQLAEVIRTVLPAKVQSLLGAIGSTLPLLMLRNVPIDSVIPMDQEIGKRRAQKGQVSERVLLALNYLMGVRIHSNPKEQDGKLVHDVAPHPDYMKTKSSLGVEPLAHHTESPQEDNPPQVLTLLGLHGDKDAKTAFVPVTAILNQLSQRIIKILEEPLYKIRSGASYMGNTTTSLRSILADNHLYYIADPERVIPQNERAKEAREALDTAIIAAQESDGIEITLQAGDAVIFNNGSLSHGVMHARIGQVTDPNRWLQRVLGFYDDVSVTIPEEVVAQVSTIHGKEVWASLVTYKGPERRNIC